MSKSALLSSSIAKKYWMALTGLFLCLFLIGHLLGNLQLILLHGEEGKRSFNEYAYFMTHNPAVKILSYLTYLSILFHAIDGILLTIQNKKARPIGYAYNNPNANSKAFARQMAVLGSIILIFIVIHMSNFWWKMKHSSDPMPLHTIVVSSPQSPEKKEFYITRNESYMGVDDFKPGPTGEAQLEIRDETEFYSKQAGVKVGEGYKDLYSLTVAFFGKNTSAIKANENAGFAVAFYVFAMIALSFHLMHGFSSAFQSLGINHRRYTPGIKLFGKIFSILVPVGFALIPLYIFFTK